MIVLGSGRQRNLQGTLFFQVAETDWHKKLTLDRLYFPKVMGTVEWALNLMGSTK